MNERMMCLAGAIICGTVVAAPAVAAPRSRGNFTPVDRGYRVKGSGNSDSLRRMLSRAKRRP